MSNAFDRAFERPDWPQYFMSFAEDAATRSNCIRRQVGAVIIREHRIIAAGYNGTPDRTKNCFDGGCARCLSSELESGQSLETCLCVHAETNAIVQAARFGTPTYGGIMYCTLKPWFTCLKLVIQAGLVGVVFQQPYSIGESKELHETYDRLCTEASVFVSQLDKALVAE